MFMISTFYWNLAATDLAREVYIAGTNDRITVLELPYGYYSAYIFDPSETRAPVCADSPSFEGFLGFGEAVSDKTVDRVLWSEGK